MGRTGPVIVSASADHVTRVVVVAMVIASRAIIRQFLPDRERLDSPTVSGDQSDQSRTRTTSLDQRSFRDQLAFSIGFAVTRSRALLRRLLTEHAPDDARQTLAKRVVEHLEQSGFEIDEAEQVMRKRPPARTTASPPLRFNRRVRRCRAQGELFR
jgi:hypothetical protein